MESSRIEITGWEVKIGQDEGWRLFLLPTMNGKFDKWSFPLKVKMRHQTFTFLHCCLLLYDLSILESSFSIILVSLNLTMPFLQKMWTSGKMSLSRMKRKWATKSRHILRWKFICGLCDNYLFLHGLNYLILLYWHSSKELLWKDKMSCR